MILIAARPLEGGTALGEFEKRRYELFAKTLVEVPVAFQPASCPNAAPTTNDECQRYLLSIFPL